MPKILDIIFKSFGIVMIFPIIFPIIVLYFIYLFIRYLFFIVKKTIFFFKGNFKDGKFDQIKSNQRIFCLFTLILILQLTLIIINIINIISIGY